MIPIRRFLYPPIPHSPQLESQNTNNLLTTCPPLSTMPMPITASVPTKPTYSLFFRPPSGTPGISTMSGKQGITLRIQGHFSEPFSSVRVLPTVVPLGAHRVKCRRTSISYLRCNDLLRLIMLNLKAIIPVQGMDDIRSPRGEALRSPRIAKRDHHYYGGPRYRAWSFRSAKCMASCDLQYNHRGTYHPSGELPLVP